ncbi:MAG TPA: bifunctional shikimate kinase/3-dehydroquinate synthase [Gaiellaceae bacterium]|nr:bifunctional shikimate kinase/3-dehydroquinate synthase [Gaiellaceae bacterium]
MAHALDRHVALIGFMGAGKTTMGLQVAERLGRRLVDLDRQIERSTVRSIQELFEERGEVEFRVLEAEATVEALRNERPAVLALGGGAVETPKIRKALREQALTVYLEVGAGTAWARASGAGRPLARDEESFRALHERRLPLYEETADVTAASAEEIVLAAAGIHVEEGALARLPELLPDGDVELIADASVLAIHPQPLDAPVHTLRGGEEAKSIAAVGRIWRDLRLDRDGTIVAVGGGCTTDVAGFVSATYLRGVAWVAVPTTLVGQVDAAIGGKTAVNLPEGKNLVGAFHWPELTVVDPNLLQTLPPAERRAGTAEVVKTGLLVGEPLWELPDAELVRRCAAYKAAVCLRDPHERGERAVLNLGHTFAHALEAAGGYGEVSHGDAVALGLLAALRLSELDTAPVEEVLSPEPVRVDRDAAWAALARDKKGRAGKPRLVLLEAPGKPVTGVELPDDQVRAALDELIAE